MLNNTSLKNSSNIRKHIEIDNITGSTNNKTETIITKQLYNVCLLLGNANIWFVDLNNCVKISFYRNTNLLLLKYVHV